MHLLLDNQIVNLALDKFPICELKNIKHLKKYIKYSEVRWYMGIVFTNIDIFTYF